MRFKAGPGPRVYVDNVLIFGGGVLLLLSFSSKAAVILPFVGPIMIGAAFIHIFYRAFINLFKVGL